MFVRVSVICVASLLLLACTSINQGIEIADGQEFEGNLSTVNGPIRIGADCTVNGNLANVNGSIQVGPGSVTGSIRNVNGSISVEDKASVGAIETVNGALRLGNEVRIAGAASTVNGSLQGGTDVHIEGNASTVNGRLTLAAGSRVAGRVSTVNGGIRLEASQAVAVETTSGSIELLDGTIIEGTLRVREPSREQRDRPRVLIGADVRVGGPLQFDRPVELYIHESAEVGEIHGAEARFFSGEQP